MFKFCVQIYGINVNS